MDSTARPPAKMATQYIVKQASTQHEMDDIMEIIWAANYDPYEPFIQLFCPVLGFRPRDRLAAIAESKERFWNDHQMSTSSNWFYVQDILTGKVVGCAQWEIFNQNPFPEGPPKLRAPWWPEGEHREFCEHIMNQVYKPRASWMTRPHIALNWMAVHPLHRRRGIGNMLMKVGVELADSLNVEAWMEASAMGKPLYEDHGFRPLLKIAFDTSKRDASDVWRKCEHEMTPQPIFAMWRPKGGVWNVAGVDVNMPWEVRR